MKKIREKKVKNKNANGKSTPRFPNQSENDESMSKYKKIKIQKIIPKRAKNGQMIPDLPIFREV